MATTDTNPPSMARRFRFLLIAVLVVVIGYGAIWFWISRQVDAGVTQALADAQAAGLAVGCSDRSITGFPFRMGVQCAATSLAGADGSRTEAGALRSTALVHKPELILIELDAPAQFTAPAGETLSLDWQSARASFRHDNGTLERLSTIIETPSVQVEAGPEITAVKAELHARLRERAGDLAVSFDALGTNGLPPLNGNLSATSDNAIELVAALQRFGASGLRGQTLTLTDLTLETRDGGRLAVSGPLAVSAQGLVDAGLAVTLDRPEALAEYVSALGGVLGQDLSAVVQPLAALGASGGGEIAITIRQSRIMAGFIPLGVLPPI